MGTNAINHVNCDAEWDIQQSAKNAKVWTTSGQFVRPKAGCPIYLHLKQFTSLALNDLRFLRGWNIPSVAQLSPKSRLEVLIRAQVKYLFHTLRTPSRLSDWVINYSLDQIITRLSLSKPYSDQQNTVSFALPLQLPKYCTTSLIQIFISV